MFSFNTGALVPHIFINHIVLKVDKNTQLLLYKALAFCHTNYEILSNTPDEEHNQNKLHRLATGRYKIINCSEKLFYVFKMWKETIGNVLMMCTMLAFSRTICLENGFTTICMFPEWEHNSGVMYIPQRKFGRVFAISTNKKGEVLLKW